MTGSFPGDTEVLREELLAIHGIGEETADDILLYAAEKPSFVVDAYTRRILGHLDLSPDQETYAAYQELFHRALPKDVPLYNEYHALLDRHAKGYLPQASSLCWLLPAGYLRHWIAQPGAC